MQDLVLIYCCVDCKYILRFPAGFYVFKIHKEVLTGPEDFLFLSQL